VARSSPGSASRTAPGPLGTGDAPGESVETGTDATSDGGPPVDALRAARPVGVPSWPRQQRRDPEPFVVEVSIGRVEVRVPAGPARPARSRGSAREPVEAARDLEGYLRGRARGELR
jgi:hypothetical protein